MAYEHSNEHLETLGDRLMADARCVLDMEHEIDARCTDVHDAVVSVLDADIGALSFAIARRCEVECGRALWDAEFADADGREREALRLSECLPRPS